MLERAVKIGVLDRYRQLPTRKLHNLEQLGRKGSAADRRLKVGETEQLAVMINGNDHG